MSVPMLYAIMMTLFFPLATLPLLRKNCFFVDFLPQKTGYIHVMGFSASYGQIIPIERLIYIIFYPFFPFWNVDGGTFVTKLYLR